MLSMVAEMELTCIKERKRAGTGAAKASRVYNCTRRSIDREAVQRPKTKGFGATAIARRLGICGASDYKVSAAVLPSDPR